MTTSISTDIIQQLKNSKQVAIVPHKNPDGDAIGSSLGLHLFLKKIGIQSRVVVQDNIPFFLNFLPDISSIIVYENTTAAAIDWIQNADMIISTDYSQLERCGDLAQYIRNNSCKRIVIDHHPFPEENVALLFHDVTASSTCELIYWFATSAFPEVKLDEEIATCLYSGLLTDTGSFKFALRPETFIVASELLKYKINVEKITTAIFDVNTPQRLKLLGYALNEKMVILSEIHTAYIWLTAEEISACNIRKGDLEGFVNYTLSVQGIKFGVFFHEKQDGGTKISFRSKGQFPVNEFSSRFFNGGGHRNAAGGFFPGKCEDAVQNFLENLPSFHSLLIESNS